MKWNKEKEIFFDNMEVTIYGLGTEGSRDGYFDLFGAKVSFRIVMKGW